MSELYTRGTQIIYVPTELWKNGVPDLTGSDIEYGFLESEPFYSDTWSTDLAHVRYWRRNLSLQQLVSMGLEDIEGYLRTKANSEATNVDCLVLFNSVSPAVVARALELYCS
jgi:hypothetical protein